MRKEQRKNDRAEKRMTELGNEKFQEIKYVDGVNVKIEIFWNGC